MPLRLVSSGDERALAIRDHLLKLVRAHGTLQVQRGPVRLVSLHFDQWTIEHWTPFNELSLGEASSPGYRRALERQHTRRDLTYGLDAWHDNKRVLRVLWANGEYAEVIVFVRGRWKDEALAL